MREITDAWRIKEEESSNEILHYQDIWDALGCYKSLNQSLFKCPREICWSLCVMLRGEYCRGKNCINAANGAQWSLHFYSKGMIFQARCKSSVKVYTKLVNSTYAVQILQFKQDVKLQHQLIHAHEGKLDFTVLNHCIILQL